MDEHELLVKERANLTISLQISKERVENTRLRIEEIDKILDSR